MEVGKLIKKYLSQGKMMQIATSAGEQPWICTVYFVPDEKQNLYWLSFAARRHSKEIEKNNHVAIAIPIKFDEDPVAGIQAEGMVEIVKDAVMVKGVMKNYVGKYGKGQDFYDNFVAGTNKHQMYKFTPSLYQLFDEVNFPDSSPQHWRPGKD